MYRLCPATCLKCGKHKTQKRLSAAANVMQCAFKTYTLPCDKARYEPSLTSPAECARLSGDLCSRKDVKCYLDITELLDASDAVIATGHHKVMRICNAAIKGGE